MCENSDKKILIVDDEPVITNTLSRFLLARGFSKLESVNDPHHTHLAIDDFQPDLILLDILMPEIDGLDLLRQLQDRIRENSITVIVVTAKDDQETKQNALALGACDFIHKPVDAEDLVQRVTDALENKTRESVI